MPPKTAGPDPLENEDTLDAGDFSSWLDEMRTALDGGGGTDVPCAGCTACCTSSQFVHIAPDETDTLAHIPPDLLFAAPRSAPGHVVLGYDERGHCPMLVDSRCSIYEHRPAACRTYDCRIFAATGTMASDRTQVRITHRVTRWRFTYPSGTDTAQHDALRSAVAYLRANEEVWPDARKPPHPTRLALTAVAIADLFVVSDSDPASRAHVAPDLATVQARVAALAQSDH